MLAKMNELSPTDRAYQKAHDEAEAKVEAFNKVAKAIAEKAATELRNAMKELDLEHSDFHRNSAKRRENSNHSELVVDMVATFEDAVDLPDPEARGLGAADDADHGGY